MHHLSVSQPSVRAADVGPLPTPYLVIVSPPQPSSLASNSATIRNHAAAARSQGSSTPITGEDKNVVAKVTLFDPENKFVAFSGTFGGGGAGGGDMAAEGSGIKTVVEAWGAIWVLTEAGQVCHPCLTSVYSSKTAARPLHRPARAHSSSASRNNLSRIRSRPCSSATCSPSRSDSRKVAESARTRSPTFTEGEPRRARL